MDNLRWRSCISWLDKKYLSESFTHIRKDCENYTFIHRTVNVFCSSWCHFHVNRTFFSLTSQAFWVQKLEYFTIKYAKCFSKLILAFFAHAIYTLTRFFTAVKCTLTPGTRRARFPIKASNTKENFFKSSRSMKPQLFWGEIKSSVIMFDIQKFEIFKQEKFTHSFKNKL